MLAEEEFLRIIKQLEEIYGIKVAVKFKLNANSKYRAEYNPATNTITVFKPIITTPYHEYGHALYHALMRKMRIVTDSETFAQRFSTMWLNINDTGFRCVCGSRKLIPATPVRRPTIRMLWVMCLDCGRVYKLKNPIFLKVHYNP